VFKKPVSGDLSFLLLNEFIRRQLHCGHKGMNMASNSTQVDCGILNDAQLVLKGPKCAKKISNTPLKHQPEPFTQGSMLSCFFTQSFEPTKLMLQQK